MKLMPNTFETEKTQASDWFRCLRDSIVAEFHAIEMRHNADAPAGVFAAEHGVNVTTPVDVFSE